MARSKNNNKDPRAQNPPSKPANSLGTSVTHKTSPRGPTQVYVPKEHSGPAQLEVPEGYKPKRKRNHKSRRNNKVVALPGDSIESQIVQIPALGLQSSTTITMPHYGPRHSLQDVPECYTRRLGIVKRFSGDIVQRMVFRNDRVWKSLGKNASQWLGYYEEYQRRKLDPEVFAVEHTDPSGEQNAWEIIAGDLDKYQALRAQYYVDEGRVGKLEALQKNVNWPNQFGIMTKAPFVRTLATEHHYVEDMSNRLLPIFKAMSVPEIAQTILAHMSTFIPMARLSQTCHRGFDVVAMNTERWDMTSGDFLGDDGDEGYETELDTTGNPLPLIVGPVRKDMLVTEKKRPEITAGLYMHEFNATVKLFKALNYRAPSLTSLQLHRIQFLEVHGVECIIASLPNLENLGVYQCPLLHLSTGMALLDAVKRHPKGVMRKYVNLDFFPMYHQGPNDMARHGSYGVSWNMVGCDTATAILAIVLYQLYPAAKEVGIDLFSWGSAFRLFLEKCPMPKWAVVKLYEAIKTYECATHSVADFRDLNNYDRGSKAWQTFADEAAAAVIGEDHNPFIVNTKDDQRLEEYARMKGPAAPYRRKDYWWRTLNKCITCKRSMLDTFIIFGEGWCWGCVLTDHLNKQNDHHKTVKAKAAGAWLRGRQTVSPTQLETLDESQFVLPEEDAADQKVRLANARCLKDALINKRIESGRVYAGLADGIRQNEMQHGYNHNSSIAGDPDVMSLERGHSKYFESHGPIDRRTKDTQYRPVGFFNTAVTNVYVPKSTEFAGAMSSLHLGEWRETIQDRFPSLPPAAINIKLSDYWGQHLERNVEYYEDQREARIHNDNRNVKARHSQLVKRRGTPNRQILDWDMLVGQMLVERYPEYCKPKVKVSKINW